MGGRGWGKGGGGRGHPSPRKIKRQKIWANVYENLLFPENETYIKTSKKGQHISTDWKKNQEAIKVEDSCCSSCPW